MSNIDKRAQKELYANVEQQAHSLRGNPSEYQAVTGMCPVNVIEMQAQKIRALLDELEAKDKRIAELEALASLEADPVASSDLGAVKFEYTGAGDYYGYGFYRDGVQVDVDITKPLYTATPAPVSVPDELTREEYKRRFMEDDNFNDTFRGGWNACRAAMLQGADGNSPVIPDGLRLALSNAGIAAPESDEMLAATCDKHIQELVTWVKERKHFQPAPAVSDAWVACSERMPEKGKTLALFGKRIKEVCANYVDEGYIGGDREFYFFDWEGGPRIDDCDPYDKAIVTHWMYWELPAAPKQKNEKNTESRCTIQTAPALDSLPKSAGSLCSNSPVVTDGWVMVPVDMTPEQMRAVQLNSELGAYAAANLTGAYSLFREFWDVAIAAAPQQEVKP